MNTIFIVLPILTILMYELGLNLKWSDFKLFRHRPKAIVVGLFGQLVILPLIAMLMVLVLDLSPLFAIGFILIACCPGGSSSNIFSMLAKGDVALSVSLTACSSIITMFTIPAVMSLGLWLIGDSSGVTVHLPVGKLFMQNVVLMFVPIILGMLTRRHACVAARKIDVVLRKAAFPALLLLITVFYIQNSETIRENILGLGAAAGCLILLAIASGGALCRLTHLAGVERKTIVIEIGMQNAAQAIAIAASPLVFNNDVIAVPAIIYSLMMNIILLIYVGIVKRK